MVGPGPAPPAYSPSVPGHRGGRCQRMSGTGRAGTRSGRHPEGDVSRHPGYEGPGLSLGSRSHDHASWPSTRKASRTRPLNSHVDFERHPGHDPTIRTPRYRDPGRVAVERHEVELPPPGGLQHVRHGWWQLPQMLAILVHRHPEQEPVRVGALENRAAARPSAQALVLVLDVDDPRALSSASLNHLGRCAVFTSAMRCSSPTISPSPI